MQTACDITQTKALYFARLFNYLPWNVQRVFARSGAHACSTMPTHSFGLGTGVDGGGGPEI
jgi:hypothetical protein